MGWVWREEDEANHSNSFNISEFGDLNDNPTSDSGDRCSTRRIVHSKCNTEEVEPGKFIRKCEKIEQILRDCIGKPTEIVQSNKEYTEEDVTDELKRGSSILSADTTNGHPFEFPGFRSDIEAIERSVFGGISRFFGVADEMRNEFSRLMGDPSLFNGGSSSSSRRREIPIDGHILKEPNISNNTESGNVDLSGLARDV